MVDVTPPEPFTIGLDTGGDPTNPVPKLKFTTTDKTSGIALYTVIIGSDTKKVMPEEVANGYYQPSPLAPGEYKVQIAPADKAGNTASSSITFIIEPLRAPIITDIPKVLPTNEQLIVRGTSFYPRVTLKLYLSKGEKDVQEYSLKTDDQGNWSYFHKGRMEKGNYEVWAKIVDDRGAQSLDSSHELLAVVSASIIANWGWLIIIILLIIIALLVLYIIYREKMFRDELERIKRETEELKEKTKKIFYALREESQELIELTDKKPGLSESERRTKEKFEEALEIAEEFIDKEIVDIEKEIKIEKKSEK
jgi:sensor histidine kinase YesM